MRFEELKTPCYIIDDKGYRDNIEELKQEYEKRWQGRVIYGYSVKTNHLPYMLKVAHEYGFYAEVVSPDEYYFAKACGVPEDKIIYNGPQKRDTVIDAIVNGAMVNLDNLEEVSYVCENLPEEVKERACIGIRINYDLESECPGETTCKGVVGRFGISYENGDASLAIKLLKDAGIRLSGLHMHQSSSSRSLNIYTSITKKALAIIEEYGLKELEYIDIGGGYFGGNFFKGKPSVSDYAECICGILKEKVDMSKVTLVLEPGAAILATSMNYLASVLNIRDIRGSRVVTLDGSVVHINPFMNPHETPFEMINPGEETDMPQIIGGSTCMEMDRFYPRGISNIANKDSKFLFYCCGAYMSTHNSSFINVAPHIYLKKGEEYSVVREKNQEQMLIY